MPCKACPWLQQTVNVPFQEPDSSIVKVIKIISTLVYLVIYNLTYNIIMC